MRALKVPVLARASVPAILLAQLPAVLVADVKEQEDPTLPFSRSNTTLGFLPNINSNGENSVEACGTSCTANKRGESH